MSESKWILTWFVVHSVVLVLLVALVIASNMFAQHRLDQTTVLLHKRIGEIVTTIDQHTKKITDLRLQYDPHKRLEAVEKWQRTFCSGPKIEACGQLGKVNR